jgi:hypothetical protein
VPNLDVRGIVELTAAAAIVIGLLGTLVIGMRQGIGSRTIKFAGAIMLVPVILILALEGVLEPAALGTVIGAVIGYLLSGISELMTRANQGGPPA